MNYIEAVRLAKAGDEKGFDFLYEETYRSKYYLALQYMKNEEAAKDVLQDAYMKAFSKIAMLEQPEAFTGWLGAIVSNTAKNALAKKNPMLFSDIAVDERSESFEYQIEDDNLDHQPEIAYTRQETQELVRELIDELSEEQRICILMFHIEGAPIRKIADTMDCSENTVKSRLKYGRDNLKIKAEELQKKGYKMYSIAPLPLLLYLLRTEEAYLSADGTLAAAGKRMAEQIFRFSATVDDTVVAVGVKRAAGNIAKEAIRGFLHTVVGKVALVGAGLCVVVGAGYYGVSKMDAKEQKPKTEVVSGIEDTTLEETNPIEDEKGTEQNASVMDGWRKAYIEVIRNAPNQVYDSDNLIVVNPYIVYQLLDMEGDSIPELMVIVTSGEDGGLGTLSFRNPIVLIYHYSEDTGAQLQQDYVFYMPVFLKDRNNNLIVSEIGGATGQATYCLVRMENVKFYEEIIYKEQFPTYEYSYTFNQEHGFVEIEDSKVDDLTLIMEYGKTTKSDEDIKADLGSGADTEKKAYVGTYKNSIGDSATIKMSKNGQLKFIFQNSGDKEYNIDTKNKKDNGSFEAYIDKNNSGEVSFCIYIYSVGIELSAYDHNTSKMQTTDKNKIRLFLTYQDVPDIKTNVYNKMN